VYSKLPKQLKMYYVNKRLYNRPCDMDAALKAFKLSRRENYQSFTGESITSADIYLVRRSKFIFLNVGILVFSNDGG
jgi:hypothetical protein